MPASSPEAATAPAATAPTPGEKSAAGATKNSVVPKAAPSEEQTVVENNLYRIVFTNRGAQVKSWVLKKYKDEDGHPLDLVNLQAEKFGLPLSLYTYDENLRNQINSALYVASAIRQHHRARRADLRIRRRATSASARRFSSATAT